MTGAEQSTGRVEQALSALVDDPGRALVVSDIDGTLAPITERAEDTRADPAAVEALAEVARRVGRVALLSGRPAGVAARLGAFDRVPGLLILGHYGLDRWEGGRLHEPAADPAVARALARVPALPPGAYVEEKGLSFVVHTRPAADPAAALAALDAPLRQLAAEEGLEVVDGSFARELRPAGIDKGTALRELASGGGWSSYPAVGDADAVGAVDLAPVHRPSAVVYLGDDDGDLPAADALAELRSEGTPTILVGSQRPDGSAALLARADVIVDGVAGVTRWLRQLSERL